MTGKTKIALTGFMGVGKSSVARHLAYFLRCERLDLDSFIEENDGRKVVEIIDGESLEAFRAVETRCLKAAVACDNVRVLSLGGGTWTVAENREIIRSCGLTTVWLDATFEHCWNNISKSRKDRPLARNKRLAEQLFAERQQIYCLADWHFVVRPDASSFAVARQIFEDVFCGDYEN